MTKLTDKSILSPFSVVLSDFSPSMKEYCYSMSIAKEHYLTQKYIIKEEIHYGRIQSHP